MFTLKRPTYDTKHSNPIGWHDVDTDADYGGLLRRNLVAGKVVGAVSFGNNLTYLVFTDETMMKVVYEVPLDTTKNQS